MKQLKKLIAMAVIICLISMFAATVYADGGNVTFEVVSASVVDGYADIKVLMPENDGIAGFKLNVEYNRNILIPISVTRGEIIPSGYFIDNVSSDAGTEYDCLSVFWSNTSDVIKTGVVFTVRFAVSDALEAKTPVKLSYTSGYICDQNYNDLNVTLTDGEVRRGTVEEPANVDYTVSSLEGDANQSKFYAEVTITKNTDRDADDLIVVAVYQDGILYDWIHWKTTGISNGKTITLSGRLYGCEGAVMKAFVWDGLTTMRSLSNVITK